jgi:hypothetical protein
MISKKVKELFVSMMEATKDSAIVYDNQTEQYSGYFNKAVVEKYIDLGGLLFVEECAGQITVLLSNRDDFLSSFAAGIREASLGNDQAYADYNANPFAFSVGFEHYQQVIKKSSKYLNYICHGFENPKTGLIHLQ